MTDGVCILERREENDKPHHAMNDALICAGHDRQIRGYLTELANYPAALVAAVHAETMSVKISSITVTGSTDEKMPIGEDRADHLLDIRDILWSWSTTVADTRGMRRPDLSDVWVTARFLARHQLWIVGQDIVKEYHSELRDLTSTGRGLLHPNKGPARTQLPCPLTDSEGCTGTLINVPTSEDDDQINTTCDCCGYILPAAQWRTYRRQLEKRLNPDAPEGRRLATEEEALLWAVAEGVRLASTTLRSWVHRGQITRHERDGRPLYDLNELAARTEHQKAA